jgi:uncharacterized protein (DUF1697 family)
MPRYAAFLRAVNVGGRTVRMAALRELLVEAGLNDVATHIQTGNVVFSSGLRSTAKVEALFEQVQREAFGFEVVTMVRSRPELEAAIEAGRALTDPGRHMMSICKSAPPREATLALHGWEADGERARVLGREIHTFYDKPYNEAKLATRLEKLAQTPATTREFRVVEAVLGLM